VTIKRVYQTLLQLYPADYKALFAAEMLNTFVKADEECRAKGRLRFMRFVFAEMMGLLAGAVTEWALELSTGRSIRDRLSNPSVGGRQDDIAEAEKRIETMIGNMVHAIANHDFPKARFYSDQERAARDHLWRLQNGHGPHGFSADVPRWG
jgi:hypothetical protein